MKAWKRWPGSDAVEKPLFILPYTPQTECYLEPVEPINCEKTGDVLWNHNEPAWTRPFIIAANLNLGDKAAVAEFKEWLKKERERTGIPSPRGGSNQAIGKKIWRFLEAIDLHRAGLLASSRGEAGPYTLSRAQKLWEYLRSDPAPYTPEYYFRTVISEVAKYGRIREGSL